jgi:ubiquinone/menaquinone biosynthesis C-methylase UbiE
LSRKICVAAKTLAPSKEVVCASIQSLPFNDDTFDLVTDISTLDHVEPSGAGGVFKEYARVLKAGGILLLCVDSKFSFAWEVYRRTLPYKVCSWSPPNLKAFVLSEGFEILRTHFVNTPFELISGKLSRLSYSRWSNLFSFWAQYYMIIARKQTGS